MTPEALIALTDRAAFLHERLAGTWQAYADPFSRQTAQSRLARWQQLAAGGDPDAFRRRLAWLGVCLPHPSTGSGCGIGQAHPGLDLVSDGCMMGREALPAWTEVVAAAGDTADAVAGFVDAAQARLEQTAGPALALFSPAARRSLTDYLADRLTALSVPTLAAVGHNRGVAGLSQSHPVLVRQLAERSLHWVAEIRDFLDRLAADGPDLADRAGVFSLGPGLIAQVRPGLSDPHRSGRMVWAVTLAGSSTVAYKPKDLRMDHAWNGLIDWCNRRGLTPQLGTLWTLPRDGYGWMAWADPRPAANSEEIHRLSRRAGMILGLLQLLHAADCHADNLVAQADHLLLVDAEMIAYPQLGDLAHADPLDVLRTGLLPRWMADAGGWTEFGGLPAGMVHWPQVVAGFVEMSRFLAREWADLCAVDGPLAPFRRGHVRFAPRPTAAYARLLDHLRSPSCLGDGATFSIECDRLARTYLSGPDQGQLAPFLQDELAALAQGDVPHFTLPVGDPGPWGLRWPPFSRPDPAQSTHEAALIRASLDRALCLPSPADRFVDVAVALAEVLADRAVPLPGGGIGWIAPRFRPESGLHQHGPVGEDFYAGRPGIGLFLAALHRLTGEGHWADLALAAARPADGAAHDAGGQLYALGQIARLLDDPRPGRWAIDLARRSPTFEKSRTSGQWGILDGHAGLILGLLALSGSWAPPETVVTNLGDHLLAERADWLHPDRGLGGISHGAAGIALALAQLHATSCNPSFLDGARCAWAFQRSLFAHPPGNWQDRRGPVPVYLHNWCNGAAGIGLAAALSLEAVPALAGELTPIVEQSAHLLRAPDALPWLDTVCCGGFGQIDCLLEMGQQLKRPGWTDHAVDQARARLRRAGADGHFRLYDELPPHLFNPTFYRGAAGIGYTLLRLAVAAREVAGHLSCALGWGTQGF